MTGGLARGSARRQPAGGRSMQIPRRWMRERYPMADTIGSPVDVQGTPAQLAERLARNPIRLIRFFRG
jgi:hypothetical protein